MVCAVSEELRQKRQSILALGNSENFKLTTRSRNSIMLQLLKMNGRGGSYNLSLFIHFVSVRCFGEVAGKFSRFFY